MSDPTGTNPNSSPSRSPHAVDWLVGGGELGELIRAKDWSQTPLGPIETWPQSLRSAVSILLPSKAQILLAWGPELVVIYNDAYCPVLGAKHPRALGVPIREVWQELWGAFLRELFEGVLRTGEAFWARDLPFALERFGYPEETFFDVSYDPVRDESGQVGGIFCIVCETTARVLGDRRLKTLRELSTIGTAQAGSEESACRAAAEVLTSNRHDLPFTLLYLCNPDQSAAHLVAASGRSVGEVGAPRDVPLSATEEDQETWPLAAALESGAPVATRVAERFGSIPSRVWPEDVSTALILPIHLPGHERGAGFLVAGISPRRPLDDEYTAFLELLTGQIATILANARVYEQERRRAEALLELDRAKTTFFSNVSHEFRTPLTLMLGPLAELLAEAEAQHRPEERERLEVVYRNSLRLQKLVNTLLDFSRIEAGRAVARFEPTDLAPLTAGLAASFRSACDQAGLELVVDCPPLPRPVLVDRDMWEKIVLNLVSNAFKYTFEGCIEVSLRSEGDAVLLAVRDTGTGIPAAELPLLFERFHQVEGARGRTQEGSGIGLALVRELARMHGGEVDVISTLGQGSVFTVRLPLRAPETSHTEAAPGVRPEGNAPDAFLEEAQRWLPNTQLAASTSGGGGGTEPSAANDDTDRPRIVLADDNADMRDYIRRLLSDRCQVLAVADGTQALAIIREAQPELVLSDVMMPGLDGFGLVHALRHDPATAHIPVILLSARAGEEASVEGMESGANDYLTKPFSARELLARVSAQLELVRTRRRVDQERQRADTQRQEADRHKDEFLATLAHELRNPLAPLRNSLELLKMAGDRKDVSDRACAVMERQLAQLIRLVDDLLDVSRITRGKIELRRERIVLARVLEHAIEMSRPLIEGGRHQLHVRLAEEPISLDADPARIAQVVSNLLLNAAKYTPDGGEIMLSVRRDGETAEIEIQDTGIGIPPEQLPRVFDMFMQADRSLGKSQGGLGIGLTLVRRLVEMHGGTIEARSDGEGQGSQFVVRLPIAGAAAVGKPGSPPL